TNAVAMSKLNAESSPVRLADETEGWMELKRGDFRSLTVTRRNAIPLADRPTLPSVTVVAVREPPMPANRWPESICRSSTSAPVRSEERRVGEERGWGGGADEQE